MLIGKVLLTGGAGFLGRAIVKRAARENWPATFTVMSRDETKHDAYRGFDNVRCVIGDVRDYDRLEAVMHGHETVVNTAAVKYIGAAEACVHEAMATNYLGVVNVCRAAVRAGVSTVIQISTDKAADPLNLYGVSKLAAERYLGQDARLMTQAYGAGGPLFVGVRYGNVLASTGSVVPLFLEQARRHKVTITDPKMSRFWLSPDQAVDLVDEASHLPINHNGCVLIGACPAMRIGDLARACWELARVGDPFSYDEIGARPGEKTDEVLFSEAEAPRIRRYRYGEDLVLPMYLMYPPLAHAIPAETGPEVPRGYSSSNPQRWLGVMEMQELIHDALRV